MAGPYVNPTLFFEPGRMLAQTNQGNAAADYSRMLTSQIPYARAIQDEERARSLAAERAAGEAIMRMLRGGGMGAPAGPVWGDNPEFAALPAPPAMGPAPQAPMPGQPSVPMAPPPALNAGSAWPMNAISSRQPLPAPIMAATNADAGQIRARELQPNGGGMLPAPPIIHGGGAPQIPAAPAGGPPMAPPPPYQTVESAAQARPPVAPAAPATISQPPVMNFEKATDALISQGLSGADLYRALNKMAPMMDAQFQQHVKLLNQEIAFLKSQQAAADKAADRQSRESIAVGRDETRRDIAEATNQVRRDIAALRAGQNALPKPKPGYMWNAEGTEQVMIKGGPAWQKAKEALDKDTKNQRLLDGFIEAEIRNIDKLIGSENGKIKPHPGLTSATGSIDPYFPTLMTDTRNAEELIKSLQSKASISSLQTIRGTAGAIGTMTEREWPRLENMKAALSAFQGTQQFIDEARNYRRELVRMKQAGERDIQAAHADFYGAQPAGAGGGGGQAGAAPSAGGESQYVEIRTTRDGRRLGKKADGTIEVIPAGR